MIFKDISREIDKCIEVLNYKSLRGIERNSINAYFDSLNKELEEWEK